MHHLRPLLAVRTMAPYYGLKTTNATWAAHCQGQCRNSSVDITCFQFTGISFHYLWCFIKYLHVHASPVCKATELETFGMRGHSMKLGRGTLMETSRYVGQGSNHLDIRAMNSMNSQYGHLCCWYTEHGSDTACEARTLGQLLDGESESAVLLLHHDRNHCTCS